MDDVITEMAFVEQAIKDAEAGLKALFAKKRQLKAEVEKASKAGEEEELRDKLKEAGLDAEAIEIAMKVQSKKTRAFAHRRKPGDVIPVVMRVLTAEGQRMEQIAKQMPGYGNACIRRSLNELIDDGVVDAEGERRGRKYRLLPQ